MSVEAFDTFPIWSPDGDAILFLSRDQPGPTTSRDTFRVPSTNGLGPAGGMARFPCVWFTIVPRRRSSVERRLGCAACRDQPWPRPVTTLNRRLPWNSPASYAAGLMLWLR